MNVPQHISELLGIKQDVSEGELKSVLESSIDGAPPLSSDEAISLFLDLLSADLAIDTCDLIHAKSAPEYHEAMANSRICVRIVEVPFIENEYPVFPTMAEAVMAYYYWETPGAPFEETIKTLSNKAIVLYETGTNQCWKDLIFCAYNIRPKSSTHSSIDSPWKAKTLSIDSVAVASPPLVKLGILKEALLETSIKWQFLGFYRVLENSYIHAVLEELNREYLLNPKLALKHATKNISNEIAQFIKLVDEKGYQDDFKYFADLCYAIKDTGNTFAIKLIHQCEEHEVWSGVSGHRYKTGVLMCYQIRCAIVHAGDSHLIYDNFNDAEEALEIIHSVLQDVVFKLMGMSFN